MNGWMIANALTLKNQSMAKNDHHAPNDGRYQGLRKDPDAPRFSIFTPQTILSVTIEDTPYRNRPHRIIFWSEFKGEPAPMVKVAATDDDLKTIYQVFKNRMERTQNG